MRDEHIKALLENAPLAALSASELAKVRAHADACAECARAYEAARISSLLLSQRAAETFEPSPFFQTKVLAALRARQTASQPWTLTRVWKATGALVASMAATVAVLASVTFIYPGAPAGPAQQETASISDPYSAEDAILAQGAQADDDMTYDEVLSTIYESEEDAAR